MPIKWDELPHQLLRHAAQESMLFGSRARACQDSKLHILVGWRNAPGECALS